MTDGYIIKKLLRSYSLIRLAAWWQCTPVADGTHHPFDFGELRCVDFSNLGNILVSFSKAFFAKTK